jgi:hypothetical protein
MVAAGCLVFTVFLSFVLVTVDGGRLAYNTREATALWLDWASRLASLADGVPAWFRGQEWIFARDVAIWIAAFAAAWFVARTIDAKALLQDSTRFATVLAALNGIAAMVALTIVWDLHGVSGTRAAPAQLALLHGIATEPRALLAQVAPPRALTRDQAIGMLRIVADVRPGAAGGLGRNERPLVALPSVPAGRYRVSVRTSGPGGWLLLGVGQDQFALRSEPLAWPPAPIDIELPVDVRTLAVRGDEDARRSVRGVDIQPLSLAPVDARLTDQLARRAVKYATAAVFFLDERSFPEPEGFWVGGRRESTIVLQPDRPTTGVAVKVRNAPVDNVVTVSSGQWREVLTLAGSEERTVVVPIAPAPRAALVTVSSAAGFRPSESEPGSRDERVLGVWVKVGG